jgi:nitrate/nitrite transport system ATP-binding protein
MSALSIQDVGIAFATRSGPYRALEHINLEVEDGEFVCLIGHSGCGKSTLLNLVAGLALPTEGSINCGGVPVRAPGADRGMVFQSHSLLPWLTCFENVMLGVENVFGARETRRQLEDRVNRAIDLVHLSAAARKYPFEISGGMKQRVGIARALAIEPRVLLLDEPFGALDALTRASLQDELNKIVGDVRTTVLMVTHDVDEAILLADRVVMMTNGPVARIGETVTIDLPKPRDRLLLVDQPAYGVAKRRMLDFLYRKHAHTDS